MEQILDRQAPAGPTGGLTAKLAKTWRLIARYGLYGGVRLVVDVVISRLVFPKALLIRRPFYVRIEGQLDLQPGFLSGPGLVMDALGSDSHIQIGTNVKVNAHVHIAAAKSVVIGNRVLMASGVFISDHSHGSYSGSDASSPLTPPNERPLIAKEVRIGDDTWLGEKVAVLPGVTIGKGCVVGAGAVVTSNLPDYTIAVGAPARPIKRYDFETKAWVKL